MAGLRVRRVRGGAKLRGGAVDAAAPRVLYYVQQTMRRTTVCLPSSAVLSEIPYI